MTAESPEDTEAAALRFARHLRRGDLLLLTGPLGAGKTTFVRGLARGLRVEGLVQSPTFQLLRIHSGDPALVHVDIFRLADSAELQDLGLDEYLETAVVVIEWGDRLEGMPAARRGTVSLDPVGAERRLLRIVEGPEQWSW